MELKSQAKQVESGGQFLEWVKSHKPSCNMYLLSYKQNIIIFLNTNFIILFFSQLVFDTEEFVLD